MKTALVTGGAGGLGRAICAAFDGAGYRVGVMDLDHAATIGAADLRNGVALPASVTDEASVDAALASFGEVPDVLVNAAGIVCKTPILEHSLADFRKVIEVNLVGAFIVSKAVAKGMVQRGSGNIVNISSIGSITASTNCGAYGPSKAGITNMTKLFAVELAPHGIRVNSVAPGMIAAGMGEIAVHDPKIGALRRSMVPGGKLGQAEDVAKVVLFLASDDAQYISGEQIVVDAALTVSVMAQAQDGQVRERDEVTA
jgi:NAD(P)-dependent dehydrogenase (short-subunit alcohol dehydrogenase family)